MSKHVRRPGLRRFVDTTHAALRSRLFLCAIAAVAGGLLMNQGVATAATLIHSGDIADNAVHNRHVADGTLTYKDLGPALKAKIDAIGQGGTDATFEIRGDGHLWQVTPTEKDLGRVVGQNGQDAPQPVSVTAQTAITNRPDGGHGTPTWATDAMTRTVAIQRHAHVSVDHCGGSEDTDCWFYTATVSDVGTFTTNDGATSPNNGDPINGTVTGTVNGVGHYEFYSSDGGPNANKVPATEDDGSGVINGSANWPALAFADGTVHGMSEHSYSYSYVAPNTCEQWVDASNNNDGADESAGDITGTNQC